MNLKNFFKPNREKIVIFLVLFLFLPFPIYVAEPVCPKAIGYECKPYWTLIPFFFAGFVKTATLSGEFVLLSFGFLKEFWSYFLINLVWSYFLACLIIRIYERMKK